MSSAFQWDQFTSLPQNNQKPKSTGFSWGEYPSLPSFKPPAEPPKENDTLSGVGKSIGRGLLKGAQRLGRGLGGLPDNPLERFEQGKTPRSPQEITQEFDVQVEEKIPKDTSSVIERGIERFLTEAPSVAAFPGAAAPAIGRAALSSGASQLVEELGGGETAQNIAGITAALSPSVAKKLLTSGKLGEIVKTGRELGLTDAQIAPLLQGETKQKWLSALAVKGGKTQATLEETKKGLIGIYDTIRSSDAATKALSTPVKYKTLGKLEEIVSKLPTEFRSGIASDLEELSKSGAIKGNNLIDFWQKINALVSDNPKKYSKLTLMKPAINKALNSLSPELGKSFQQANQLYGKYAEIASKLKPGIADAILKVGEITGGLWSLFTGNLPALASIAGESGVRRIGRELLINPRFQQLGQKLVSAFNQGKWVAAKKIADQYAKEVEPFSKDLAKQIRDTDFSKVEAELDK